MADKAISELTAATQVTPTDLFVLEQSGTAKKLTGQTLENWLVSLADGHGGIQSVDKTGTSGLVDTYTITLADTTTITFTVTNGKSITGNSKTSTSGLVDTYTITYNDGTSTKFTVTNGRGIKSWAKTGTSGLVDTYTITYNDGTSTTYTVTNGAKGDKGDTPHVYYKWASQEPTEESHSMGDVPDAWQGIYAGYAEEAPTDWTQYVWYKVKGDKGDTGAPATKVSDTVEYMASDSGQIIPSGSWSTTIPYVAQGRYLWTRVTTTFNTGDPVVSYSVARMGIDGSGSVSAVNDVSPDAYGNVQLKPDSIGALAFDGSNTMVGDLPMGGHKIVNLADPEDATDAATKGYTDTKADLPKTVSGTVITINDASDWALQGLRIYGKTTQDGTPTPDAPVGLVSVGDGGSVGVTVAGKNLLKYPYGDSTKTVNGITFTDNGDGTITANGTATANADFVLAGSTGATAPYIANGGKRIVGCPAGGGSSTYFVRASDNTNYSYTDMGNGCDVQSAIRYVYIRVISGATVNNIIFKPMITDYQDTQYTDWESYKAPQTLPISTPNGLPGIPVYIGGNYTDAAGQQYIANYRDYGRGVDVHRIFTYTTTGDEIITVSNTSDFRLLCSYNNFPKALDQYYRKNGLCSILATVEQANLGSVTSGFVANANVLFFKTGEEITLEYAKSILQKGLTFAYVMADPVETPIPEDELAAYAAIHTNKPNTTIYNDVGAYMDVGYYTPTATMLQADIAKELGKMLPKSGGIMTGPINMNGQPISGLNDPTEDTQAARKAYVDNAVSKARPYNLLDNSYFINPVNQRGASNWDSNGYIIDRWMIYSADTGKRTAALTSDGLRCDYSGSVRQIVPKSVVNYDLVNGEYTIVMASAYGTVRVKNTSIYTNESGDYVVTLDAGTWVYAALYEGVYTAETLPEYQPKGYAAELAECQRYALVFPLGAVFRADQISANALQFTVPVGAFRIKPSIASDSLLVCTKAGVAQSDFTFTVSLYGGGFVRIQAAKSSHGMEDAILRINTDTLLSADL